MKDLSTKYRVIVNRSHTRYRVQVKNDFGYQTLIEEGAYVEFSDPSQARDKIRSLIEREIDEDEDTWTEVLDF